MSVPLLLFSILPLVTGLLGFTLPETLGKPIPKTIEEAEELLSEKDLPLILPPLTDFAPNPDYYAPLQKAEN